MSDSQKLQEVGSELFFGALSLLITYGARKAYSKSCSDAQLIENAKLKNIKDVEVGDFVKIKGKTYTPEPLVSPWKSVLCTSFLYQKGKRFETKTKIKSITENTNTNTNSNSTSVNVGIKDPNITANVSAQNSQTYQNKNRNQNEEEKEVWEYGRDVENKKSEKKDLYLKDETGQIVIFKPETASHYTLAKIDEVYTPYPVDNSNNTSKKYVGEFEEEFAMTLDQPFIVYGKVMNVEDRKVVRQYKEFPFYFTNKSQEEIVEKLQSDGNFSWWISSIFGVVGMGLLGRAGYVIYDHFKK